MKIVFLDSLPSNKSDLDLSIFEELGELMNYDLTSPDETLERVKDAEVIITNKVVILAEHFAAAQNLKLVCSLATGYDHIDLEAAKKHEVMVCNVPAYSTDSVAQTTFAHILELTQHLGEHSRAVYEGEWSASPAFCFTKFPLVELSGKTLLVVGLGSIGKKVAEIATAFGMKVISTSLRNNHHDGPYPSLPLDEALAVADIVTLHVPASEETQGIVNEDWLTKMKSSAFLINTARGTLINEAELAEALENEVISGYACDVLSQEPPPADNPLLSAPNCIISPHLAWATLESRQRLWHVCADNIKAFLAGEPQNLVG